MEIKEEIMAARVNSRNEISLKNLPDVFVILKWMLSLGILFIILLSGINTKTFFFSIGNAMLIAGAFYGAGGLAGFLFGIPKIIQNGHVASADGVVNESEIIHNDNLVQISDWLTKIMVGVGLTQLYNIPGELYRIGEKFGTSILGDVAGKSHEMGTNVSVAIILYFSVLGFMMVYIWTRVYFVQVLKMTDNILKKLQKTEAENKAIKGEKEEIENQLTDTIKENKELEKAKVELDAIITTFPAVTQDIKEKQIEMKKDEEVENDPHKGKFGGMSERNERVLSGKVRETSYDKDLFIVDLEVTSTNPDNPLSGEVTFFLHPSFYNSEEKIRVVNGKAENKLISYGAFTVGVECDNGQTKLELDLALLPNAPTLFKER